MKKVNKTYLGSDKDMAQHHFDAYQVEDEMHIYYESGHVAVEKVAKIKENLHAYLWTPYVVFIEKCGYNNSTN